MPTAGPHNSKIYKPIIEDSHLLGSYMALFSIIESPKNRPFLTGGGGGRARIIFPEISQRENGIFDNTYRNLTYGAKFAKLNLLVKKLDFSP